MTGEILDSFLDVKSNVFNEKSKIENFIALLSGFKECTSHETDVFNSYVKVLKDCLELKIYSPFRFPLRTLKEIIRNRKTPDLTKKISLIFLSEASADYNGAFFNTPLIEQIFNDFTITPILFEARTVKEIASQGAQFFDQYKLSSEEVFFMGHANVNSMTLSRSSDGFKSFAMNKRNLKVICSALENTPFISSSAVIVMDGCSTHEKIEKIL